jgi:peptidylprolyl isomerase
MKLNVLIGCLLAGIAITACGSSDAETEPDGSKAANSGAKSSAPLKEVKGTASPPPLEVPPGPPPKRVIIKDLRKGRGVEIKRGDEFSTNYISLDYESGKQVEEYWRREPFEWIWGYGDALTKGWEIGLEGMRVGGLRKLIVPSKLAYGDGDRVYVVELLAVE